MIINPIKPIVLTNDLINQSYFTPKFVVRDEK